MSLYEKLGREQGIGAAVEEFYRRVLADPHLEHYFTGVDMPRLKRHQALLLVQVTGGPQGYDGRDLADAHQHLGISGADFDRVVSHLAGTLTHLGVQDEDVATIGAALGEHRGSIVAAGTTAAGE